MRCGHCSNSTAGGARSLRAENATKETTWLDEAHDALDAAVAAAYGWTPSISNDDALEAVLELNGTQSRNDRLQLQVHVQGRRS